MRRRIAASILAVGLLLMVAPAHAADSLLGTFQNKFVLYHVYDAPGGASAVEEVSADVSSAKAGQGPTLFSMFSGPVDAVVRWKAGSTPFTPLHTARRTEITMVLQGNLVFGFKDGREQRVGAGQVVLIEDYVGSGHGVRCDAVNPEVGCIQVFLYPLDDSYLAAIPRSGRGFCAVDCAVSTPAGKPRPTGAQ